MVRMNMYERLTVPSGTIPPNNNRSTTSETERDDNRCVGAHIYTSTRRPDKSNPYWPLIVKMHLKSVHPNQSQSIYFCFRHAKWAQWPNTLVKSSVGAIQDPHRSTSRVLSHHKLQEVSHRSSSTSPKSNHLLSCKWVTQKQFTWALNCN